MENVKDLRWEKNYAAAKEYYREHGDLLPKVNDKAYRGVKLGSWISQLRTYRKSGICSAYLTGERIKMLDEIGMAWDVPDYLFEKNYAALLDYYKENGNADVPSYYVTADGLKLGTWVCNTRNRLKGAGKGAELTEEQKRRLDELGFSWEGTFRNTWNKNYEAACKYKEKYGDLKIPVAYVSENGIKLGTWFRHQMDIGERLPAEKKEKLLALGVSFVKEDSWEVRYALAKAYYEEYGNLNIPPEYKVNGIWIAKWVNEQRQIYIGNRGEKSLTDFQVKRLNEIGMVWENSNRLKNLNAWESRYNEAKRYYDMHGNLTVSNDFVGSDRKKLAPWIIAQRRYYEKGKLSCEQIERLSAIGMVWTFEDPWENGFAHAKEYYAKHGDLLVKGDYASDDGYALGVWIANQRFVYKGNTSKKLTDEQKKRLDEIGFVADVNEHKWNYAYERAAEYYRDNGTTKVPRGYKVDGIDLQSWFSEQRRAIKKGKLTSAQLMKLSRIGICG